MLTGNTQFESELKKRISEEIDRLRHILEIGDRVAIPDYVTYREHVGRLAALRLTITDYCDDVTATINKQR